ncbi:MAG: tetratricopeptide repeat protein [Acidobacteriota bacterium]
MKIKCFIVLTVLILLGLQCVFAQNNPPVPLPGITESPKLSDILSKNLEQQNADVSRERREQAYAKLLEGQRYIWNLRKPQRSQAAVTAAALLARQSLQKSVEFDPTLAEGYTALAEIIWITPPNDLDEAIRLGNIAVKIDPNNFGGHQILARLYTYKSNLNRENLNPEFTQKAISEWKEIARLDYRNAEAFAFLNEFYGKTNKPDERIEALKKWLAAVAPIDTRFYRAIIGKQADLSPEYASLELGEALIQKGETSEAVEILSRAVADNPDNSQAVELLRAAIETSDNNSIKMAVEALQQAVFANSDNVSLIILLAQVQNRVGKVDDATKILRDATVKFAGKDDASAAALQVALADIYVTANRYNEAIAAYQNALAARGIGKNEFAADDEREFALAVYGRMINAYKKANRPQEALETIRALRAKNTLDTELLRLEATTLTENGKVDEAVALLNNWVNTPRGYGSGAGAGKVSIDPAIDEKFTNYLFVSTLYSQAKRGKQAIEAANQALKIAQTDDRRLNAKLMLATAQQMAGEYANAETTLRELLKESPQNPVALNNLGYFLIERDEKLNEAVNLIQQAVKLNPTNSSYLDSLGWAYFKLGKFDEAEKYLKDALRLDASSSTINEHLGDVHQKQGKPELAKSAWQKALNFTNDVDEINRLKTKLNSKVLK